MAVSTESMTGSDTDALGVREKAEEGMRGQLESAGRKAGAQVSAMTDALRRTGEQLRTEGKDQPARMVEKVAERGERLGGYLERSEPRQVLHDAEDAARQRPWLVAGMAFAGGIVASRFLKASSDDRSSTGMRASTTSRRASSVPTSPGPYGSGETPIAPAAVPAATSIPGTTL